MVSRTVNRGTPQKTDSSVSNGGCTFGKVLKETIKGLEKMLDQFREEQGKKWDQQSGKNTLLFEKLEKLLEIIHRIEIKVFVIAAVTTLIGSFAGTIIFKLIDKVI